MYMICYAGTIVMDFEHLHRYFPSALSICMAKHNRPERAIDTEDIYIILVVFHGHLDTMLSS